MAASMFHLIGAGRGGTSLLLGLLDANPDCEMMAEVFSIKFLMSGNSEHDGLPIAERTRNRIADFEAACSSAASSSARLWGHKTTTEQIAGLYEPVSTDDDFDAAAAFVEATLGSPVVFILRDGRTCIASKMKRTGQPLELAIDRWKFCVSLLEALRRRHENLLVVRMEDLVESPVHTLTRICGFLGITYTDAMLAGTESAKMMPEYRRPGFDRSTIAVGDAPVWQREIERELTLTGYL